MEGVELFTGEKGIRRIKEEHKRRFWRKK